MICCQYGKWRGSIGRNRMWHPKINTLTLPVHSQAMANGKCFLNLFQLFQDMKMLFTWFELPTNLHGKCLLHMHKFGNKAEGFGFLLIVHNSQQPKNEGAMRWSEFIEASMMVIFDVVSNENKSLRKANRLRQVFHIYAWKFPEQNEMAVVCSQVYFEISR